MVNIGMAVFAPIKCENTGNMIKEPPKPAIPEIVAANQETNNKINHVIIVILFLGEEDLFDKSPVAIWLKKLYKTSVLQ